MDMNERELSLQYLFHLKALEYAKRHVNREIKQRKSAIQTLDSEINNLSIPQNIAIPNMERPSKWYTIKWAGKWFVFLGLSVIVLCVLSLLTGRQNTFWSGVGIGILKIASTLFALVCIIYVLVSSYRNAGVRRQYNAAMAQYKDSCKQESQRIADEDAIQKNKIQEMNQYIEEEKELQGLLKSIKEARALLYSVNYIPYQYRNLESVGFFYSQVKSSPIVLNELIRCDPAYVANGYNSIPDFIKTQDDIYSFPTVNRIDFWNSCNLLVKKFDTYILEKDENSLEQNMQKLIETIRKEGLGMKYNFNGPVTAGVIGDENQGKIEVKSPMTDYQSAVEEEIDDELVKRIIGDMAEEIKRSNAENAQELLRKLNEMEPQLTRQQSEPKETWWERIKESLQIFANFAGIAEFAFSAYTLLK